MNNKYWLSLGGGVQSTAMALMIIDKTIDISLDGIIFADTGSEPPHVYDAVNVVRQKAEANDIQFAIVKNSKYSSLEDAIRTVQTTKNGNTNVAYLPVVFFKNNDTGKKFVMNRQCTNHFKIMPVNKFLKSQTKGNIFVYLGISTDEIERIKPSQTKRIIHKFPLINARKSRNDCLLYLQKQGLNILKSRCYYCGYQSNSNWHEIKKNYPELWQKAISLDEHIRNANSSIRGQGFLHKSMTPLKDVNLSEYDHVDLFGNECGGNCAL